MTISPTTSTTSMADPEQASVIADMASVSLQGLKSDQLPIYAPSLEQQQRLVEDENPSTSNSTSNNKDPELRWYLEVFLNESGESFAQLFDILLRRNDMVEEDIHRQIKALPASDGERKVNLAIAMMELRLEQSWLQSQKDTYLAYPAEREAVREGVVLKVMGIIQSRDLARKYFATERLMESAGGLGSELDSEMLQFSLRTYQRDNPSTPLREIRWQELKQEYTEEARQREKQDAYWRAKAEEFRRAAEGKMIEDESYRRKKYEEDVAKWQKKYEEDAAKRKKKYEEDAALWQKKLEEDAVKWERELEEEKTKWLKQDAEEYAKWQKKEAEDFARWQKQDAEYLAKWQKRDVEILAKQRIKITEDVAKSRARDAQDRAKLRTKEAADHAEST
ncbi:hypothetical protein BGZ59_001654 [Podila verticillata]|nr:hypothetical protein BGZ59_001654 [Podila verticillata]KFH66551.1 hypothetical protein MVEG_07076 [Podila verticillata NRRL 6337]